MPRNHQPPKRQRALDLVLAGRSHAEIAAELGCRRETIWKWSRDPSFAGEVAARRADRRASVGSELDAAAQEAVRTLRLLMNASDVPPAVRVRAASDLLDRAGVPKTERVEHTGQVEYTGLEALSDEELQAEVEAALAEVERFRRWPGEERTGAPSTG